MTKDNLINIISSIDKRNEGLGILSYNPKYIFVLKILIKAFEEEGNDSKVQELKQKLSFAESLK